jgi:hypothetical protein
MVDFDMDCSETENGWFDFKGYLTNFGKFFVKKFDLSETGFFKKLLFFVKFRPCLGI